MGSKIMRNTNKYRIFTIFFAVLIFIGVLIFGMSDPVYASEADSKTAAVSSTMPVYGEDVHDGAYVIDVDAESVLFSVENGVLIVADGEMHVKLTTSDTECRKLFLGSTADAANADESAYVPATKDDNGNDTFSIPVESLNGILACSCLDEDEGVWREGSLFFRADSLPAGSLKSTASQAYKTIENDVLDVEDGIYRASLTMTGGTGKASIASPVQLEIRGGEATASLEWSSEHYDYMIVNGERYLPVNESGNSVFEVPVVVYDRPFAVMGDTTAMSVPHEIEYMLTIDSSTLEKVSKNSAGKIAAPVLVGLAVVLTVICISCRHKRPAADRGKAKT